MTQALSLLARRDTLEGFREDDVAWDLFVARSATRTPLRLTAWARVKSPASWRSARVVVDRSSGPIGAQVLTRRLGPGGHFRFWYAPRGPIATRRDEPSLSAFTAALRRFARRPLPFAELSDGSPAATTLLVSCEGRVTQPYSGMTEAGVRAVRSPDLEPER